MNIFYFVLQKCYPIRYIRVSNVWFVAPNVNSVNMVSFTGVCEDSRAKSKSSPQELCVALRSAFHQMFLGKYKIPRYGYPVPQLQFITGDELVQRNVPPATVPFGLILTVIHMKRPEIRPDKTRTSLKTIDSSNTAKKTRELPKYERMVVF